MIYNNENCLFLKILCDLILRKPILFLKKEKIKEKAVQCKLTFYFVTQITKLLSLYVFNTSLSIIF